MSRLLLGIVSGLLIAACAQPRATLPTASPAPSSPVPTVAAIQLTSVPRTQAPVATTSPANTFCAARPSDLFSRDVYDVVCVPSGARAASAYLMVVPGWERGRIMTLGNFSADTAYARSGLPATHRAPVVDVELRPSADTALASIDERMTSWLRPTGALAERTMLPRGVLAQGGWNLDFASYKITFARDAVVFEIDVWAIGAPPSATTRASMRKTAIDFATAFVEALP
jgi:hypothetical protein